VEKKGFPFLIEAMGHLRERAMRHACGLLGTVTCARR